MEDEPNEPREDESPFEIRPVFSEMETEKEKEAEAEEEVELPKTPQEEQLGYNSMVWAEALFKRFIDAISGRGGVEAITGYADQIDFIELLTPLRQRMKNNDMFFQTALSKCNKDLLKRPLLIREDESYDILGFACENCGKQLLNRKSFCGCGGKSRPLAVKVFRKLRSEGLRKITPETVLMDVGYDRLADAYCDAFMAFRLITTKTAELFGWEDRFRIENPELLNYMDHYFLGRLPGESKIPREEKEVLQFLVRGNIVLIPLPTAFNLIRQGISVVKYGYMFEVLGCTGADLRYRELAATFGDAYDAVNKTIRKELYADREERKRTKTSVNKVVDGIYAPCMLMPRHFWENGTIANQVILEPVFKLPVHPKADDGSLQMLYAPIGKGKTFLLSSIVTYGVDIKHELVFNVLGDKSNSFMLSCLPLFGYNARTNALVKRLDEELGVQPHGIPTLNLTFLRKDEKVPNEKTTNPPTKYDRIIRIDDPHDFEVPFDLIMAEFKKIVKDFDYTKAVGIINVRNLDRVIRLGTKESENIDVQVAINILTKFDAWRKGDLTQSMRLLIDEMSYVAPSQVMLYAGDASRSGATISDFLKESRRDNCSIDGATQRPLEIITDIRDSSTNVFFRELPASKAKDKSQIDFILESILLYDPSVRPIVRDISNRGLLSKDHYWFWWNKQTRSINVIRPSPPTFCLQDPKKTSAQIIKMYEKETGEQVLLGSWDEVPTLTHAASDAHKEKVGAIPI